VVSIFRLRTKVWWSCDCWQSRGPEVCGTLYSWWPSGCCCNCWKWSCCSQICWNVVHRKTAAESRSAARCTGLGRAVLMKQHQYQAVLYWHSNSQRFQYFLHTWHFTRNVNMFLYNIAQIVRLLCIKYILYCLMHMFTVWASTISKM